MKKAQEPFETIIHETLKEAGLLFPISDKEIEEFESRFTELTLPEKLKNAEHILDRNRQKIKTVQEPILKAAALFDASEIQSITSTNSPKKTKAKRKK